MPEEQITAFTRRNRAKITCINVSRHMVSYVEECRDELLSQLEVPVRINCVLFIINLIPVPPLDGAHFLKYAINMSEETYYSVSRYGIAILLAIIWIPFTNRILMTIIGALISVFETVSLLIINIFAGK